MALQYFKIEEFRCKCGRSDCDAWPIDMTAAMKLDDLRREFGVPLTITSACRCAAHNKAVGGKPYSWHLKGLAFDVHCPDGVFMRRLVQIALRRGFAIGVGEGFVHLDCRPGPPIMFGY